MKRTKRKRPILVGPWVTFSCSSAAKYGLHSTKQRLFFLLLTFLSKMKKERKKRNRHFLTWKRISRCLAFWTRWKNPHNRTSCHFLIAAIPTIASRCRNSHFCHFFFVIYSCVLNFLFLSPPFGCSSKVLLTTLDNRRGQEDPLF